MKRKQHSLNVLHQSDNKITDFFLLSKKSHIINFKPQILPLTYSSGLVILMKQQNHGELDGSHRNKCSLLSVNNENQTLKTPERNQSIFRQVKSFFSIARRICRCFENFRLLFLYEFLPIG